MTQEELEEVGRARTEMEEVVSSEQWAEEVAREMEDGVGGEEAAAGAGAAVPTIKQKLATKLDVNGAAGVAVAAANTVEEIVEGLQELTKANLQDLVVALGRPLSAKTGRPLTRGRKDARSVTVATLPPQDGYRRRRRRRLARPARRMSRSMESKDMTRMKEI